MFLKEGVILHNELNPKLWDKNNQLLPDVKEKFLQILEQFKESIGVDLNVIDAIIVGSNASYNYTDTSDIDFHLVVNPIAIEASPEILQLVYNYAKSKFNADYNITIHGLEVEVYIQDANSTVNSNGMYSVMYDKWIKFPQKIKPLEIDVSDVYEKWKKVIENVLVNGTADDIQDVINKIYVIRRNSVNNVGEFGRGNILFKTIRSNGYLDKLRERYKELVSSDLSLEAFLQRQSNTSDEILDEASRQQIINKAKSSSEGMKRYKKRVKSKVLMSSKNFNNIDMNKLFTNNILTVDLDVKGETDTYTVKISFGGFLDILHDQLKNSNTDIIDTRMITRALVTGFNRNDVYIHCSCDDFQMRYAYFATRNNLNSGVAENRPSDKTNPNDKLGSACKHSLCVLSNTSWILRVATVIHNYIKYMERNKKDLYQKIIYPAIYQKQYQEEKTVDEQSAQESDEQS